MLIDLHISNFALGKLPLRRVHRGDFPSLKPNFIPKVHIETLQKHYKTFKYIKEHIT